MLASPTGRTTLLAPDARELAVGIVSGDDPPHLGIVLTAYTFFAGDDRTADAQRVLANLVRVRALRGLPAPTALGDLAALHGAAVAVANGRVWPDVALRDSIDADARSVARPLRAAHVEAYGLAELPFPPELVNAPSVALAVVVTHVHPEGTPWGQYVVYLVMADPA